MKKGPEHHLAAMRNWLLVDLPVTPYEKALNLQRSIVAARSSHNFELDVVLMLEHPPVFTLGRRGGRQNLKKPETELATSGISVIQVERGGDITYHAPGQLVVYALIDLKKRKQGVVDFVTDMEEVMIRTAKDWGVTAERNPANRGVWVGPAKLGSIGIAVRKGISFHGLAMNVNTDLKPFEWIHPCGLEGVSITSLRQILTREIPMGALRKNLADHMQTVFNIRLSPIQPVELIKMLGNQNHAPSA